MKTNPDLLIMTDSADAQTRDSLKTLAQNIVSDGEDAETTGAVIIAGVMRAVDTAPEFPEANGEPGQYYIGQATKYRKNGAAYYEDETDKWKDLDAGTYVYLFLCYATNQWAKIRLQAIW